MRRSLAIAVIASFVSSCTAVLAASPPVVLAPHRAVYGMSLGTARAGSQITSIRGRMVYELTGSRCDGWTQNMRYVTEMASQDGSPVLTDLRSSTWEDDAATLFRFTTSQLRDEKPGDATVGDAKRAGPAGPITADLTKPGKRSVTLQSGTYFPVQHSIALIQAGRSGQGMFRAPLYDGSEKGDKVYDTLARIGRKIDTGANAKLPAAKNASALDAVSAWPVSISYFEPNSDKTDATPVYEMSFLFFENGVSRRLVIDYGDFAIKGELVDLAMSEPAKCDR